MQGAHLVGGGGDGKLAGGFVIPQPPPSGALHGDSLRGELLLQGVQGAKVALNQGQQLALRRNPVPSPVSHARDTHTHVLVTTEVSLWGKQNVYKHQKAWKCSRRPQ